MNTPYHPKYYSYELTKRCSSDNLEKLSQTFNNATIDLNPHQIDAALFAFKSPLSRGALLADEVGLGKFQNLTLKKIPNAVLRKCEWGRDDYSLEIKDLPQKPEEEAVPQPKTKSRSKAERRDQPNLFELPGNKGDTL